MPDTEQADGPYYTVEDVANLTGRSDQMVRRWIREEVVQSIQDPSDGRRRLVPWGELAVIAGQPRRGYRRKTVTLTRSDGSTFTIVAPTRNK
jgi:predicted transcriptional regulator